MITDKKELKNVPLTDLIPYARNPRKNDAAVQKVAASLKEYGLVKNSVVVDENMVLITGHTTTKAMQAIKWTHAPEVTQVFGLTEAQKKAYRLADNRLGEEAKWDKELLALEIEDLKAMNYDLDLTGFDEKELTPDPPQTYSIEDFVFDGPVIPCWFVIRADQENYTEIEATLAPIIKKYKARMETSEDDLSETG